MTGQELLLIARCTGHRCAALHRLNGTDPQDEAGPLRRAVRHRPDAVLVGVPCLGACERASITLVGSGFAADRSLSWTSPPVVLGATDEPPRAAALVGWIAGAAPDRVALPETLRD